MDRGEGVGFRRFGSVRAVDGIMEIAGRSLGFLVGNGKLVVGAGVIDFFFRPQSKIVVGCSPKLACLVFDLGRTFCLRFTLKLQDAELVGYCDCLLGCSSPKEK